MRGRQTQSKTKKHERQSKFRSAVASRDSKTLPHAVGVFLCPRFASPPLTNVIGGYAFRMSHETASRHTVAETCVAPLRLVLRLGHARTERLTGQHQTENDSALGLSGHCGFPFGSPSLWTGPRSVPTKPAARFPDLLLASLGTVLLLSGGSFCLGSCFFSFYFPLS